MIWLIIYITGVIIYFIWIISYTRKNHDVKLTDLYLIATTSLLSWIGVAAWTFMFLRELCYDNDFVVFKKNKDNNENNNN